MTETQREPERLDSWKAIAAYMGRGVTTVQRWEQEEGLPVRRLPHAKKGSVFAFKHELDGWRTARAQVAAASNADARTSTDTGDPETFHAPVVRARTRLAFLAGGLAVCAVVARSLSGGGFGARSSDAAGV